MYSYIGRPVAAEPGDGVHVRLWHLLNDSHTVQHLTHQIYKQSYCKSRIKANHKYKFSVVEIQSEKHSI